MSSESTIQFFNIESKFVNSGELRLNASSYKVESIKANEMLKNLKDSNYQIKKLWQLSRKIFIGKRSKRIFISKKEGLPYLQPKEIFKFDLSSTKWISIETEDVENWGVSPFMILVTQSGSAGRPLLTNELFNEKIVSQNAIRFDPNDNGRELIGYIYAYLSSWIGQALLMSDQFGITVKHIEDHHLSNVQIPIIPELTEDINDSILKSYELREESQKLLFKAEKLLYTELLTEIDEEDVDYFGGEMGKEVKSFTTNFKQLESRLDASYHIPLAHMVLESLYHLKNKGSLKKLSEVSDSFVPGRFKRNYVDPDNGIPLLQGSHIPLIKPIDIKSIWKGMKNIEKYVIKKDWILVTCSGTIGRLSLVSDYWNGWTATNHLLRIIPKETEIHPGYLTSFLLSIYGQVQFQRLVYGGVVDEIGEAGELIDDILILKPNNEDIENCIGNLVLEAYNKRDEAAKIENETIKILENRLVEISGLK